MKEDARASLYTWVGGFSRSSSGKPYLLTEAHRAALFPGAPPTAVVSPEKADPILLRVRDNLAELQVGVEGIDLSLEHIW